ncbi:MAG: hypothetical protein ACRD9L_24195 [Bryobacteraceae bacterium]
MATSPTASDPISIEIPCLVISPRVETHASLGPSLYSAKGEVRQARDCQEACQALRQNTVAVVLAETDLPDGGWRDLLILLASDPSRPKLVVLLDAGQEDYRAQLISHGAFDAVPLRAAPALVVSAVTAAYLAWLRERWMTLAARQSSHAAVAAGAGGPVTIQ